MDFKLESKTHRLSFGTLQWRPALCLAQPVLQHDIKTSQSCANLVLLVSLFLCHSHINFSKTTSRSWLAGTVGWAA
jgi:hypothetical protein